MNTYRIAVIGGDGIGPEVTRAGLVVLDAAERRFGFRTERTEVSWSSAEFLRTGQRVTPEDIEGLRWYDAVLLGAIGHPDAPRGLVERDIILGLRRVLDLYVNLRPIVLYDERLCPLKGKRPADVDFTVVRENTEDVYMNVGTIEGSGPTQTARVEMSFTRRGIERVIRYAFERARARPRRHLTLVDKANAIQVQGLWRTILDEVGAEFPDVERDAMYVDAASMWMVLKPEQFAVVVTTNLFGDILTDLGAALTGGLGSAASGNIHPGKVSVFEPIHGSAPKYAGKDVASPVGAIGAVALMLDHLGEREARAAIDAAIVEGFRSGAIKGLEAGAGGTMETARGIADAVAKGGRP
ncbi:MAG TPA: isocitrate/isopropylmalate family dehydrogenase [Candidatus Limnocylindria bacterium]|nr:isocitrate/isopropylmalate family dehydrogenase [Candidatus Limnocylindria bacterium]